jgi:hypothetical protein
VPQVQLKAVTPPDIRHRSHPDRRRLPAHRNHHTGVHRGRGCKRNRGPGRARVASSARLVALGFYFGSDHDQYLGARPPSARALIFRDRPGIPQNRPQLNKSRMNLSDRSSACESPSRRSSFTNLVSHVGPLNRRPSWLPNTTVAVERIASSVPASRPIMLTPTSRISTQRARNSPSNTCTAADISPFPSTTTATPNPPDTRVIIFGQRPRRTRPIRINDHPVSTPGPCPHSAPAPAR